MNNLVLLPRMAINGIKNNKIVYFPYILTTAFSVCVFFIFNCIINNDIIQNLPHAAYAWMLLKIGNVLLGIILVPFLFYTNSFLIKRRKNEIGLYSILGLEKKHIGFMMLVETICIYLISMVIGLLTAVVFSKLAFLILLNASGLPVNVEFTMPIISFITAFIFFGAVSILNLFTNLFQVTMVNPSELLKGSKKGEKEPKHLWIPTILGLVFLGGGYRLALISKINGNIFTNFFLAVLMVIIGTYFLFTAGSIALLQGLRKNKKFYYKKSNYITVSGMIYRMKKSAASLVNICIFSTMVIITLLCTASLYLGEEGAIRFDYPLDVKYVFDCAEMPDANFFNTQMQEIAKENNVKIADKIDFQYFIINTHQDENEFSTGDGRDLEKDPNETSVKLMSLSDYNLIESKDQTLKSDEILVYSNTEDFNYDSVNVGGRKFKIKEEIPSMRFDIKEKNNYSRQQLYFIFDDEQRTMEVAKIFSGNPAYPYYSVRFNMDGEFEHKEAFLADLDKVASQIDGFYGGSNIIDQSYDVKSMDGGLLFIGIFFGLIFTICLLLIMYYKQISEGLEDKKNFEIMQQVGLSDNDVKATIHRQIMLVFGMPLIVAILHTMVGLKMTTNLLYSLNLFNTSLIQLCAFGIIGIFTVFYVLSYLVTAKTYYNIVKSKQ